VFLVRSPRMKSTASAEMDANKSSGKSRFTCEMFSIVSCFVLPANGAQPVNMTYANTPTLLHQTHHILEILCRLCLTYRVTSQHGDIPDSSWHSYTCCVTHIVHILLHLMQGGAEVKCILVTCVCLFLSLAAFPHHCTDPDVTWGNGRGCL